MTDHALKAAREIVKSYVIRIPGAHSQAVIDAEERIAAVISQAIQEATGPYRALVKEWRDTARYLEPVGYDGSIEGRNSELASAYLIVARELEALLPKETK